MQDLTRRAYGSTRHKLERSLLFARTLRDIKPSQAIARAKLIAKEYIRRGLKIKASNSVPPGIVLLPISFVSTPVFRDGYLQRVYNAMEGAYEFLSRKVEFKEDIDWYCPGESALWRFHLNYCALTMDFAQAFRATGDRQYLDALCTHIESWIRTNILMTGDPWSPYCASLRVVNWIISCSAVWDDLVNHTSFVNMFAGSVLNHVRFIRGNLEYDVRCNHLLENIKALIVGGIFLGVEGVGAPYFELGQKLLLQQLDEQILADGGHCERSTMYHCIVLEDLLVIHGAYECACIPVPKQLIRRIREMTGFLAAMRMPSGRIPLFNDSVEDGALEPSTLIDWAETILGTASVCVDHIIHFSESGYIRAETPAGDVLFFDCGEPCPKYQPGHAHADTLSVIWALADGTEILVDSGVYEYSNGLWRRYFRSTAAHNTIQVDRCDSTEVWSSFRAARKAQIICSGFRRVGNVTHLYAKHNGYTRLPGSPVHQRDIYLYDDGTLLVLDTLLGSGEHIVESRQHFHPDCMVSSCHSAEYVVSRKEHSIQLSFLTEGEVSIYKGSTDPILGWYAPSFGSKEPSPCVVWRKRVKLPYRTGYLLHVDGSLPFKIGGDRISIPCEDLDSGVMLGKL